MNGYRKFGFLLTATILGCSGSESPVDATNDDGAGGAGGHDVVDAGHDVENDGESVEPVADSGPDGAGGAGGGSSAACGTGDPICSEVEEGFNEDEPGFIANVDLGVSLMMGQRFGFVAAFFQEAAREDWCKEAEWSVPMGSCAIVDPEDAPAPQCSSNDQCSPEQECVPRMRDGSPIACSEHCSTSRSPIDIGPLTVKGFESGPMDLVADPDQGNGYIPPGNGTVPASEFVFDTRYEISADGDASQGIGALQGHIDLGPELAIVSPPMAAAGGFGLPAIEVDPEQDLVLEWSGSVAGGEVTLELTAADFGASRGHIRCRTSDTGSFTIPAEMVKALNLGDESFLNNLDMKRIVKGSLTGEGITRAEVTAQQVLLVNLAKKASPSP